MFHRLAESLDRNTEVMQAAIETIDQISTTSNRTLHDDELIIPDRKRDVKVRSMNNAIYIHIILDIFQHF